MSNYQQLMQTEVFDYWRALTGTLEQRNLLKQKAQDGRPVKPQAVAIVDQAGDRVLYLLDMQRLAGVSRERWLDRDLWKQWRAALRGRRVAVADGYGLVICVARTPGQQCKRLPASIPLDLGDLPEGPYHVTLGHTKRGPVVLDLAEKHRAVLCGGTSGAGKTNLMQSIILQACAKHGPSEFRVAIVDTKQVDFSGPYTRLPHLFGDIAHTVAEAETLIEAVEQERLRRQALMADAGVADWRDLDGLGLLLLVVDEAADFAKTGAMETLVDVARKGRAFGVSIVLGTQLPSAKVIDAQVRANLPTAIAFRCRTHLESQAILGTGGAEKLDRPGLALTYLERWETVQVLRVKADATDGLAHQVAAPKRPALPELEAELVRYAVSELDGAFTIGALYDAFRGDVSKRQLTKLAQRWESRGWLTEPEHATDPRKVTDELAALAGVSPALDGGSDDRVTGMTGGDRAQKTVIGGDDRGAEAMIGTVTGPIPAFLQ